MRIFEYIEGKGHEQVVFCADHQVGLKAIIAIHDTTLGPALGGCRIWPYQTENEALNDVLRLSRGMTYKAAAAGLQLGGGKSVIIGDPKSIKNEALFRTFGRFVHSLGGRYITAEDVGTTVRDMDWIRLETPYVTGVSPSLGGSGDPSPVTAFGVYQGIRAALKWHTQEDSVQKRVVAIQGVGHVGYHLVKLLLEKGASVVVTDINQDNLNRVLSEFKSTKHIDVVEPEQIYGVPCDVFAPCAMGGVINDTTIPKLQCSIVAGSANNVLGDEEQHSQELRKRSILYVPDFVISSGGLINVSNEIIGYVHALAMQQTEHIYDVVLDILRRAHAEQITTLLAAQQLAQQRIQKIAHLQKFYVAGAKRGLDSIRGLNR